MEDIGTRLGPIDVLVNSAGIGGRGTAADYPPDLLTRVIDVNVKGSLYMCQAVGRRMIEQGTARSSTSLRSADWWASPAVSGTRAA